jgi:hypothetical protein
MRGAEDAQSLIDAYELTLERYEAAFGAPPADVWRPENSAKCGRKNCKPQKCR